MSSGAMPTLAVSLLFLSASAAAPATDRCNAWAGPAIDIRVQAGGFGRASFAEIAAVLQSAAGELWRHCPSTELPSIEVYHRRDHPQTDLKRTAAGRIAIGLTARDNYWAQYVFQFAHECSHALVNDRIDRGGGARLKRDPNFWLEESLCETASLFTLRGLSRAWLAAPPYPAWQDYAPWFSAYAAQRLALPHQLSARTPFTVWFRANEAALRQDSTTRDRNTIVAAQLLPVFEKDPRGWKALAFLKGAASPNQTLAQHLAGWHSRCPRELRPFVAKLAAVFDLTV